MKLHSIVSHGFFAAALIAGLLVLPGCVKEKLYDRYGKGNNEALVNVDRDEWENEVISEGSD